MMKKIMSSILVVFISLLLFSINQLAKTEVETRA